MGKTIQEIQIGDFATISKVFTENDTAMYAQLTGDFNPAHMDEAYASQSMFKKRIVHGMLVSSLFSTIFGMQFPGVGSIYTFQSLKFKRPVYFDDEMTAQVVVKEIILDRNRVIFDCIMTNQHNEVVIEGSAEIMPPRKVE